jgi:hypothetical protein
MRERQRALLQRLRTYVQAALFQPWMQQPNWGFDWLCRVTVCCGGRGHCYCCRGFRMLPCRNFCSEVQGQLPKLASWVCAEVTRVLPDHAESALVSSLMAMLGQQRSVMKCGCSGLLSPCFLPTTPRRQSLRCVRICFINRVRVPHAVYRACCLLCQAWAV